MVNHARLIVVIGMLLALIVAQLVPVPLLPTGPAVAEATFPGTNGRLLITRSHDPFEGRSRSNIALDSDGAGFVDYTSHLGFTNTQKLYYTADGNGFVGAVGFADLLADTWNPYPALPLTIAFDFTVCPDDRVYFRTTGPEADGWYVYSMTLDGSDLRQVAAVGARGLSCSPDGSKIAFVASPPDTGVYGGELFTINSDGTNLTQLTTGRSLHVDGAVPSWSPDGTTIAYTVNAGLPVDPDLRGIWTIDVEAKVETRIYSDTAARPIYSPDGTTVVFYSPNGGSPGWTDGRGMYFIDADGSNLRSFVIQDDPFTGGAAFATSWQAIPLLAPAPSGAPLSSPSSPGCTASKPSQSPQLFQIDATSTTATLFFAPTGNATSYVVSYGYAPGDDRFAVAFPYAATEAAIAYTVNDLAPDTTYYFSVRGGNGCRPGDWSNILYATTASGTAVRPRRFTAWHQVRDVVRSWGL